MCIRYFQCCLSGILLVRLWSFKKTQETPSEREREPGRDESWTCWVLEIWSLKKINLFSNTQGPDECERGSWLWTSVAKLFFFFWHYLGCWSHVYGVSYADRTHSTDSLSFARVARVGVQSKVAFMSLVEYYIFLLWNFRSSPFPRLIANDDVVHLSLTLIRA